MYPARAVYSALFFVLAMVLVFVARPALVFDRATGEPRRFGVEPGSTLVPIGVVTVVTAVGSMFLFSLVDMVCA